MTSSGQSLFEVVVAIAISALIIVALVSVTSNSIQNSSFSKNKSLASTYADQASEWLRGQRDADIRSFVAKATVSSPSGYCLSDLSFTTAVPDPVHDCLVTIPGTIFTRWVNLNVDTESGKDVITADVTVSWTDSQGVHRL
jgi:Tfp pilus assembly protein PilV